MAVGALGLVVDGHLVAVAQLLEALGTRVGALAQGGLGGGAHGAGESLAVALCGRRLGLALGDVVGLHVAVVLAALQKPPAVLELVQGHGGVLLDLGAHGLVLGAGAGAQVHLVLVDVAVLGVLLLGGGGRGVDDGGGGGRGRGGGHRLASRLGPRGRGGGGVAEAVDAPLLHEGGHRRAVVGQGRGADLEGQLVAAAVVVRDGEEHGHIPAHARGHHGVAGAVDRRAVHGHVGPGEAQELVGLVLQIGADPHVLAVVELVGAQDDHGGEGVVEEGLLLVRLLADGVDHVPLALTRGVEAEGSVHHVPLAHGHGVVVDEGVEDQLVHRGHAGGAQIVGFDQDLARHGLAGGHPGLVIGVLHVPVDGQVGKGHHEIPDGGLVGGGELQRQPLLGVEGGLVQHEGEQGALRDGLLAHPAGPIAQGLQGRRGAVGAGLGGRRVLRQMQHGGVVLPAARQQQQRRQQHQPHPRFRSFHCVYLPRSGPAPRLSLAKSYRLLYIISSPACQI